MTSGSSPLKSNRSLAQINVARLRFPEGDDRVAEFFANLGRINTIAEKSDGFVWRLIEEGGDNATGIKLSADPNLIVNMSIWRDIEALRAFVYRTEHAGIMAKRRAWFEPLHEAHQALWWVDKGSRPSVEQGMARLGLLRRHGPSASAFNFQTASQFSD